MRCRLTELRCKEVINLTDGTCLGYVDDLNIDTVENRVLALVVFGRLRLFGVLGREEDLFIPWERVETIGEDAILVRLEEEESEIKKKPGAFWSFWNA